MRTYDICYSNTNGEYYWITSVVAASRKEADKAGRRMLERRVGERILEFHMDKLVKART
jgi:hypothetical protein